MSLAIPVLQGSHLGVCLHQLATGLCDLGNYGHATDAQEFLSVICRNLAHLFNIGLQSDPLTLCLSGLAAEFSQTLHGDILTFLE